MNLIYICKGLSMLPTLPKLCLISVKKSKVYKRGDIISLKTHDNKSHAHRIIEINDDFVSTKGDNLSQHGYEINVPIKNIEGIVKLILPRKKEPEYSKNHN